MAYRKRRSFRSRRPITRGRRRFTSRRRRVRRQRIPGSPIKVGYRL